MRRVCLLTFCAAALANCTFDGELPEALLIRCGPAGECPKGYRCNADFDECRRVTTSTDELPSLAATFMPSRVVRRGATVTVVVSADRALRAEPRVRAQHPGGSLMLSPASSTDGFQQTSYAFTSTPDIKEGQVVLFADAVASTGGLITGVRLGDLIVDDTPPRLLDGATVTPARAQKGTRVTVRVEFDEPVRDTLRLVVQLPSTPQQVVPPSSNRAGAASFLVALPSDAADGVATLSLTSAMDEAGNEAPGPLTLPTLTLDSTPPTAQPLNLDGQRFSQVAGHDVVTFTVGFDEPVSDARWCFANRCESLSSPSSMVTVALADAGFPEGPAPVVITGRDAAGNVGTRTEFVALDYSAPALVSEPTSFITPRPGCALRSVSALGIGATHSLSFVLNEPLAESPVVTLGTQRWQASSAFDGGIAYTFVNVGTNAGLELSGAVTGLVVDTVGNQGTLTLVPAFRVDLSPPLPLFDAQQSLLTYERIPWGAERSAGLPRYSVEGRPGLWNADDVLVFFEGPTAQSFVLGEGRPLPSGVLPRVEFSRTDRQRIWVMRHDAACNAATADPQPLKQSSWVASALRPAGSPLNPHVLSRADVASSPPLTTRRSTLSTRGPISTTARGGWQARAAPIPASFAARFGEALTVADPLRGRTLLMGGSPTLREVWSWDGAGWSQLTIPPTMPAPSSYPAPLFEAHTGRILFFAGNPGATREFWALDGDRFTELTAPSAITTNVALEWSSDPKQQRIISFGGSTTGPGGYVNDTWVFDATGWRLLTGNPRPPNTTSRRLIYDAAGQRMVLFAHENLTRQVWVLDGETWRQLASVPGNLAFGLGGARVVFDHGLDSVVMFGGGQCCNGTSLTSRLVNDTWVSMPAPTELIGRNGPLMAYDPERRRIVMCGGYGGAAIGTLSDCWVFERSAWRPIEAPDVPALLTNGTLQFDPARRRMMLVGGFQNDTWVLEGDAWVRTSAPAALTPRLNATLAADPTHGRLLYVGGQSIPDGGSTATSLHNDVWSLSTAVTRLADAPFPGRAQHAMVSDPARSRIVLIGGRDGPLVSDYAPMDTWLFDGRQWSSLPPPPTLAGRAFPAMAADPLTGRIALVGALNPVAVRSEVWLFDGTTWAPHPSVPTNWSPQLRSTLGFGAARREFVSFAPFVNAPVDGGSVNRTEAWAFDELAFRPATGFDAGIVLIRTGAASAVDPTTGRLLTFGGSDTRDGGAFNETWSLDGTKWSSLPTPATLAPRTGATLRFHPMSNQYVLIGGGPTSTTFAEDSWAFGGDGWAPVELPSSFTQRAGLLCASDDTRNTLVVLGGSETNQVYEFSLDARSGPALMLSVDLSTLLPPGASAQVFSVTGRAAGDSVRVFDPLASRGFLLLDGGAEQADGGPLTTRDGGVFTPSDGGTFRSFSVPQPGAALQVWDPSRGAFVTMASTSQTPDAGAVVLTFTADAGAFFGTNVLHVQLTSLGGSDVTRAPGLRATVLAEPPEVEVRYVVP